MIERSVDITSLCIVSNDASDQVWLIRLADVENEKLVSPIIYDDEPRCFENRDRIYYNDGPSHNNAIGVWRWTAIPNRQNHDNDYVQSFYQEKYTPIYVFIVAGAKTQEQLIKKLKDGIVGFAYGCDTLFVYGVQKQNYHGVLCKKNEFTYENGTIKVQNNVYSLPVFDISADEVLYIKKHLRFYKRLELGSPTNHVIIGNVDRIVQKIVVGRLTWPLYRDTITRTKREWRDCKALLERICDASLYEEVASELKCSLDQAKSSIEAFVQRAYTLIDAGDIDSDTLAQIALHHPELRAQCEAVVKTAWESEHASELATAQEEAIQIRKSAEADAQKAEQQRQKALQEKRESEQVRTAVLNEIEAAKRKRDSLMEEIEQYEALGNDTVQAIRAKIGEAQEDMAGFIAELSTFLPQQRTEGLTLQQAETPNHWRFIAGKIYGDDASLQKNIEECSNWEDTLDILKDNLRMAGVCDAMAGYLAAFLYAAYVNKAHLLLAGPNAKEIANAMATAITGRSIAVIECLGEKVPDVIPSPAVGGDSIVAVENPFHPEWLTSMPYLDYGRGAAERMMLWLHPFAEDLAIEPSGLFNYVLPVFTECFIEQKASNSDMMLGGVRTGNYKEYDLQGKRPAARAYIKKLHLSRLVDARLQTMINDAKRMINSDNADFEGLFALIPFAVLTNKQSILEDFFAQNQGISHDVKQEIQRWLEEE